MAITKAPTTDVAMNTASVPKESNQSKLSGLSLPCTVPGCKKRFMTLQSRAQHLKSAIHSEKATLAITQKSAEAATPVRQFPKIVLPNAAQRMTPSNVETTTGKKTETRHAVTVEPKVHSRQSIAHHKESLNAPKPAQPSLSKDTGPLVRVPLFRWDTRWSAIPTAQYDSTTAALRALIPMSKIARSNRVDKKFWTPDHKIVPTNNSAILKRQAIVLDCEMVGIGPKGTTSELARLSAIDFLTGELLIDTLVQPLCAVTDWRTQWSGITVQAMQAAVDSGDALEGSPAARMELFKYMDSQTILVGHALHYDLEALGIRHGVIVDSSVLAKTAVGKGVRKEWGLKMLCKELLGITVQDNGKDGHDSVEDALAAREVVLWCLEHEKELKAWGSRKNKEFYANKKTGTPGQSKRGRMRAPRMVYDDDYEPEFLCLSVKELNELCHYPEWYDNWSD